jgi:hypothetical protein
MSARVATSLSVGSVARTATVSTSLMLASKEPVAADPKRYRAWEPVAQHLPLRL